MAFIFIWILSFINSQEPQQLPKPCNVFGSIYITEDLREAHYSVYEDDSEAFCDVLVFEMDNKLFADKTGLWHFVDNRAMANYVIYIEEERNLADFSIFYTDFENFAGCNQ